MHTAVVQKGLARRRVGYPQWLRPRKDARRPAVGPVALAADPVAAVWDAPVHAVLEGALLGGLLDVGVGGTAAGFRQAGALVEAGAGAVVPLGGGVAAVVDSGVGDTHCEGWAGVKVWFGWLSMLGKIQISGRIW